MACTCAIWLIYKVPIERVQVPLWELDGDGNYFVEERTFQNSHIIYVNSWPTICRSICFDTLLVRNMPVVLPHRLFPWMMRRGIWPTLENGALDEYWKHLKNVGSPLGGMSDGSHIPIYFWGDGAQYTESGESILVFTCGIVIDENRSNTFPLFMCREDAQLACLTTCLLWGIC